jgi:hypothetical protein
MRATLVTAEGVQSARVRDLTSGGAGIVCDRPPEAGTDVILKRGDLIIAARVAWSDATSAGLEFYREAPLDELLGALQTAGSAADGEEA